ncbi:efflux RND transporter permease subunit [Opitutales bacterium ASA1]|uniref:efflux RND transporter permease subunit n=1 Tax=Congregicoccus parvus TaxID=3081749 RepID=UPI002B2E6748|nr:efflux RND transporter permease subunit [Opitutales bacterium ASA1]
MSLSSISIRRPVLAIVMSTVLVIFGAVSFTRLGVREFPSVDPTVVSVSTGYPGANAFVIESQITIPIEESVNSVPGIRTVTSVSNEGRSTITIEFQLGVDLETAANDVRDKVAGTIGQLPPDVDPPRVAKADADSVPIVFLGVRSSRRDLLELSQFAENSIKPRLETIPGVSEVDIWGQRQYSMRLWMDPQRLAAYDLTPLDVRNALTQANVELPSGRVEGGLVELTVRTMSRLETVEDFNSLVVKRVGDALVRFRDVGYAELAALNDRTLLRTDGVPMVGVVLRPQPGANFIAIVDDFNERVELLRRELPEDITVSLGFDVSSYIRDSVSEVQQTIFLALGLVVAIIFLFLREWRSTFIPVVVIPIALVTTFFVMWLAGFSINVLTMLALVLAIGLVVDDAIVVLENIYAKIEAGMSPVEAGITGVREIFLAVIATTVALAAVFLPILFLGGLTGRLFREFGVVLAGAVVISSFVALTLTPMLSTRLLRHGAHDSWFYRRTEPFFVGMARAYASSLKAFMRVRWLAVPAVLGMVAAAVFLFRELPKELVPLEDRGALRIQVTAPEGTSYEYMADLMTRMDEVTRELVPEAQSVVTVTAPGFGSASSVNSGFVRLLLVPKTERTRTQAEIAADLSRALGRFSEGRVVVIQEPTIGGRRGGLPVQFVVQARTLEELQAAIPRFLQEAQSSPTFTFADVDLKFTKPELSIEIDRDRAQVLGISVLSVAQTLQSALSGQRFGYFIMDGKQYQVVGQLDRRFRSQSIDLKQIYVRSASGQSVPLDNLIRVSESSSPPRLFRYDRFAAATVSAQLAPGFTIGDGIAEMRAIADRVLDDKYFTALAGDSKEFEESSSSLLFIFLFALVLVYLVLAAQFESFRDPFIIMLTVPLALGGALVALVLAGETLNIFSQIGLIMLIGLVTKNGILIVEFANQRKVAGLDVREAIVDAAAARFRPILMTSLSTILGILPIALALGAGSESRVSMGIAVIGGLVAGTLLSLYVIPAVYSLVSRELTAEQREGIAAESETGLIPQTANK